LALSNSPSLVSRAPKTSYVAGESREIPNSETNREGVEEETLSDQEISLRRRNLPCEPERHGEVVI
jgi:hypothetical protein